MYDIQHFHTLKKTLNTDDPVQDALSLRIHRANSWLQCANACYDDDDQFYVFSWIAFNAMYGTRIQESNREQDRYKDFFTRLLAVDRDQVIYDCLWNAFSDAPRNLLNNQYLYTPYWKHQMDKNRYVHWQRQFENARKRTQKWLVKKDTVMVLSVLFDRLYVLRNQILHGLATYQSSLNRDSLATARLLVEKHLPVFMQVMLENPSTNWGSISYPPKK